MDLILTGWCLGFHSRRECIVPFSYYTSEYPNTRVARWSQVNYGYRVYEYLS